jgi:glycosyltransferase involved in cell wall biosynthesis
MGSDEREHIMAATDAGQIAVVIPAYQEAATVANVARRALAQLPWVIVVDDGSRDGTSEQLVNLPVTVLRNASNCGKAAALWLGMQHALARGATAVITLDGDGQHRPEDIPALLQGHASQPERIVIGARLQGRASAPRARGAANRFADFWISWASGYRIPDSQCGFRLYPAGVLRATAVAHDPAHGFVFESEILIDAAWRGIESVAVPVPALYPPTARRSHFRTVVDVLRITRMVAGRLLRRGLYIQGLWRSMRPMRGAAAVDAAGRAA